MKFKKFRFKKVKSTNDTAIRIIKSLNYKHGMVDIRYSINVEKANMEKNGFLIKVIYL